jgi:hypothetical protein
MNFPDIRGRVRVRTCKRGIRDLFVQWYIHANRRVDTTRDTR